MLFVGPSYQLKIRKASLQRSVNLFLAGMETPDKAPFILQSAPGLILRATLSGPCRGMLEDANGRCFAVYGATLYEIADDFTATYKGTLRTETGPVSMAYGLFQLVIVDGPNGYVLTLSDDTFQQITSDGFYGSDTVRFLSNYFLFIRPDTQQNYIAAINDATSFDPLDFASAERSPDNLVAQEVVNSTWFQLGRETTEIWFLSGAADYPFSSTGQGVMEVGCHAPHSVRQVSLNGSDCMMWIGRTKDGAGIVFRTNVYTAVRVSTQAVEQALQESTDLTQAVAWTYQKDGLSFWCVNAPGLKSTWCYETTTGAWHERCDLDASGELTQLRATHHVFAFNKNLVGGDDGKLYELSDTTHTIAGDTLVRERVSPHAATPSLKNQFFSHFVLDCTTGERAQREASVEGIDTEDRSDDMYVELSWADWKPNRALQFGNAVLRSIGYTGQTVARLIWLGHLLGYSRDRVWKVRFTRDAPFSIISADVQATEGAH